MASYTPSNVCSKRIDFDIDEENKVRDVKFHGGCSGNSAGVARLVEGRDANEVIEVLGGLSCGNKGTSCPDQLTKALANELGVG